MHRLRLPPTSYTHEYLSGRIEFAPEMDRLLAERDPTDWWEAVCSFITDPPEGCSTFEEQLLHHHFKTRGHLPGVGMHGEAVPIDTAEDPSCPLEIPIIFVSFDRYIAIKTPGAERAYVYHRLKPIWANPHIH